jgi:hypothetical protein
MSRRARRGESGLSGVAGIVIIGVSLVVVLVLVLVGSGALSGSGSGGAAPAVFSQSHNEEQLKLCVEGRPSSYGNPPSQTQQAACTRELAAQLVGGSGGVPTAPTPSGSGVTTTTLPNGLQLPS